MKRLKPDVPFEFHPLIRILQHNFTLNQGLIGITDNINEIIGKFTPQTISTPDLKVIYNSLFDENKLMEIKTSFGFEDPILGEELNTLLDFGSNHESLMPFLALYLLKSSAFWIFIPIKQINSELLNLLFKSILMSITSTYRTLASNIFLFYFLFYRIKLYSLSCGSCGLLRKSSLNELCINHNHEQVY